MSTLDVSWEDAQLASVAIEAGDVSARGMTQV